MKTIRRKIFALTLVMSGIIFSNNIFAACNMPAGLSTSNITSSSATLNWTAVSGSQGYNVRYRIVNAPSWTSTTSATNTKAISGLTSSSNYEWQVQNKCSGNQTSSWTASSTFSTLAPPCNVPTGLSTTGISSTAATLNWTAVSGAQSYNIQYRIVGAPSWTPTTSTTNTKSISSLTASSNYEWQVQTNCGSSNLSSFSASATFTTLAPPCNVPTGLSTTGISSSAATLNWTAVSGAQSYNIQYRIVGAPSWTPTTSTTNTKSISSLTASSNYEWQVQTNCGNSNLSSFSASATFSTPAPPCNVPTGLSTTGISSTAATLNWTAVSGAQSYNIQYRIVGAPSWTPTTSTTNTKSISSLTASSNYEWQVQTDCGSSNLSLYSSSVAFVTNTPVSSPLNNSGIEEPKPIDDLGSNPYSSYITANPNDPCVIAYQNDQSNIDAILCIRLQMIILNLSPGEDPTPYIDQLNETITSLTNGSGNHNNTLQNSNSGPDRVIDQNAPTGNRPH